MVACSARGLTGPLLHLGPFTYTVLALSVAHLKEEHKPSGGDGSEMSD
jgi:hypothetical protein